MSQDPPAPFKFLIITQKDKGSHTNQDGIVRQINSHTATLRHARNRRNRRQQGFQSHGTGAPKGSVADVADSAQSRSNDTTFQRRVASSHNLSEKQPISSDNRSSDHDSDIGHERRLVSELDDFHNGLSLPDRSRGSTWFNQCRSSYSTDGSSSDSTRESGDLGIPPQTSDFEQFSTLESINHDLEMHNSWELQHRELQQTQLYVHGVFRSALDPFLRLPLELSLRERSLLQFYLAQGRRLLFGTSANPRYDLVLDMASRQMQTSPLYVLTRVSLMESLVHKLSGNKLPVNFYKRIGMIYQLSHDTLTNSKSGLAEKASALQHLATMESGMGHEQLHAKVIVAWTNFLNANGGITVFQQQNEAGTAMMEPMHALGHCFMNVPAKLPDHLSFNTALDSFIDTLRSVAGWASYVHAQNQGHLSTVHSQNQERIENGMRIQSFCEYLKFIIDVYITRSQHLYGEANSAFILLLTICLTMAKFGLDTEAAIIFLETVQEYMRRSVSPTTLVGSAFSKVASLIDPDALELHPLHTNQTLEIVCHVRQGWPRGSNHTSDIESEIEFCTASFEGAKIFHLLSHSSRLHLARCLLKCIMLVVADTTTDFFQENYLDNLKEELVEAWLADCMTHAVPA